MLGKAEYALKFINEICKEKTIKCSEITKNLAKNSVITDKSKIKKKTIDNLSNIIRFNES